jgi:hypothetical protein
VPDRAKRNLLPVPTAGHADIGQALAALATDRDPRVDVVIGPGDAGKSALVRGLAPRYRALGDVVRTIDLSLVDWRRSLLDNDRVDVMLVDHVDRLPEPQHFRAAFEILDRAIPVLFARGLSRLVLTVNTDWRETFRALYRLAPEVLLDRALSEVGLVAHVIRPYTDDELERLCNGLGLAAETFAETSLRRSGVLSLAAAADDAAARLNGPCLRDVLARRWIEAGNGVRSSAARQAMWNLMGRVTLRDESFSVPLSELSGALDAGHDIATLRAQVAGPLRLEGDQVEWTSPAWGDVAGADALRAVIRDPSPGPVVGPIRRSVLDALLDTSDRSELARDVTRSMRALRTARPAGQGYLGAVLGTLSAQVVTSAELIFEDLPLQGPDHARLRSVQTEVVDVVHDALKEAMIRWVGTLATALRSLPTGARSGFRGGYEAWSAARAWARALPLRMFAEGALVKLPHGGAWRYEDVLDVAVTGATTSFLDEAAEIIRRTLDQRVSPPAEYLADVWDGVNDGAWDQIDATTRDYVGSLRLPAEMGRTLTATRCSLQRAHFGSQDVRTWRLIDCDLFLADFRSCRNVEAANFQGSNWWAAMLPPPARYFLSRTCRTPAFREWCAEPPWRNPYYTAAWPVPFD